MKVPKLKCAGPHGKGCPRYKFRGPRGGMCPECREIRRKWREREWYARGGKTSKDRIVYREHKRVTRITPEVQRARDVVSKEYGIKGALKVIHLMQRIA